MGKDSCPSPELLCVVLRRPLRQWIGHCHELDSGADYRPRVVRFWLLWTCLGPVDDRNCASKRVALGVLERSGLRSINRQHRLASPPRMVAVVPGPRTAPAWFCAFFGIAPSVLREAPTSSQARPLDHAGDRSDKVPWPAARRRQRYRGLGIVSPPLANPCFCRTLPCPAFA